MASTTDFAHGEGRPRRGPAVAGDRSRAFRAAARHTWVVRTLRLALPLASLGMVAIYGFTMRLAMGVDGLTLPQMPTITADHLKMENPRYEGYSKDGGRFVVTAKTAQQDVMSRTAPIKLTGIDGEIVQPDKSVTRLAAQRGTFDSQSSALELHGGITIAGDNGLRAELSRALVLTKEGTVTSEEPVTVALPAGVIRSNALLLKQKQKHVTFSAGVVARLNAQPAVASDTKGEAKAHEGIGRRDQPVDVSAERLVVDDVAKTATFLGNVRAAQAASTLESAELEIAYTGQAAVPGARPAAGAAAAPASKVRSIVSRTPVVITQNGDRVTADAAHFDVESERARLTGNVTMGSGADRRATADVAELDQKAETVLLTGNVHLVQAKNEMRGGRMWLDRKTARSQVTTPGGRIWARFVQPGERKSPRAKSAPETIAPIAGILGAQQFKTNPDAPVVIDADRLDVDDSAHRAVFRGDVQAVQDDFKVKTPELTAIYSGAAGMGGPIGGASGARGAGQAQAQLTRIEARKGVVVTSKEGQKATGEWANFDVKANTIVLGGNVVLSEGKQEAKGSKLVINLTTGLADLQGDADQSVFTQSGGGRPSVTFYPDQFKGRKAKPSEAVAPVPARRAAEKPFQFDR